MHFHPLEVVCRASEKQLHVDENYPNLRWKSELPHIRDHTNQY